jgi:hypothetical protein
MLLKSLIFLAAYLMAGNFSQSAGVEGPNEQSWYICYNCCKTRKSDRAPWENGCRQSASGTHNFQFSGKAGDYNYTCRRCDAEVYLTSSTSPASSRCCTTGGTHSWYHR